MHTEVLRHNTKGDLGCQDRNVREAVGVIWFHIRSEHSVDSLMCRIGGRGNDTAL